MMAFGKAIDEALSASNINRMNTDVYLQPEIVVPIFRESFAEQLPEDAGRPGNLMAAIDYFWRGEDHAEMLLHGEELLNLYYAEPWTPEDDDFVPLHSAEEINPEGVQLRLSLSLPGDYVGEFVGILDILDSTGVVVDYKARKRAGSWAGMAFDLQPTAYAALIGHKITFQFIELIRDPRKRRIAAHATHRTEEDIRWFTQYIQIVAREIDESLKAMTKELGEIDSWREDPKAVERAASFFPPAPGRRCQYDSHFIDCGYRAGGVPGE